jgi:hypothetical protein
MACGRRNKLQAAVDAGLQAPATMENWIDIGSKIIAFAALMIGAWWGVVKYLKRDEHFPRS